MSAVIGPTTGASVGAVAGGITGEIINAAHNGFTLSSFAAGFGEGAAIGAVSGAIAGGFAGARIGLTKGIGLSGVRPANTQLAYNDSNSISGVPNERFDAASDAMNTSNPECLGIGGWAARACAKMAPRFWKMPCMVIGDIAGGACVGS